MQCGRKENDCECSIDSATLDLVGSQSIPSVARDPLVPNKVLGSRGNAIFPIIFIAYLLHPYNEEINSYFQLFKRIFSSDILSP